MDPRIEKMLIRTRAEAECQKLENERVIQALRTFASFLELNMDAIRQIFSINKATFVIINSYFPDPCAKSDCLCFSPGEGFHFRKMKDSDSSPDTQRTLIRKIEDLHEIFLIIKKCDLEGFQNDFVVAICNKERYCRI